MALVGSLSGSNSIIAVSGSVIVANRPDSLFPGLPGVDVSFFVSGTRDGKGVADRTVSVFGGDTVVSGTLTIGTGSVQIDSNEVRFLGDTPTAANPPKIYSGSGGLTFVDAAGSETTLSTIRGAVAGATPGGVDQNIQFKDGTSFGGAFTLKYDKTAYQLNSGKLVVTSSDADALVSSGTMKFKDGSNNVNVQIGTAGTVSGSGAFSADNLVIGGGYSSAGVSIGPANISAKGNLTVDGNVTLGTDGADIVTINGTTTVNGNLNVLGTTTTISSSNTTIADPVVLIGSGSIGPNANSVIAFSSGSNTAADDVVFGTKGGILVAAKYNTTGGNLPYADIGAKALVDANLVGIKASQFFVNGDNTALTVIGGALVASGNASQDVSLYHGAGKSVKFVNNTTTTYLQAGIEGSDVVFKSTTNRLVVSASADLAFSGSNIDYQIGAVANAHNFKVGSGAGSLFASLTSGSYTGAANNNLGIVKGAAGKALTLAVNDGNNVNSGRINFAQGGASPGVYLYAISGSVATYNNTALLQSADGAALVLSGASALVLGGGSGAGAAGYHAFIGSNTNSQAVVRQGLFPAADKDTQQFDLGADNKRWANIYTGDLHLRNERGDYTIIEETDFLSVRFNKTGKRYKFLLERVPELDE